MPDITPLCSIVLILISMLTVVEPRGTPGRIWHPTAQNTDFLMENDYDKLLGNVLCLTGDGYTYFAQSELKDISELSPLIKKRIQEGLLKEKKIMVKAHGYLEFGKILAALEQVKNAGIRRVFLFIDGKASVLEIMSIENKKKNRLVKN